MQQAAVPCSRQQSHAAGCSPTHTTQAYELCGLSPTGAIHSPYNAVQQGQISG